MDKVRVLRVLEYVGDRKWVEETLSRSSVPLNGVKRIDNANSIKSSVLDYFPETVDINNLPREKNINDLKAIMDALKSQIGFSDKVLVNSLDVKYILEALEDSYVALS